jgi:hypothetical protein
MIMAFGGSPNDRNRSIRFVVACCVLLDCFAGVEALPRCVRFAAMRFELNLIQLVGRCVRGASLSGVDTKHSLDHSLTIPQCHLVDMASTFQIWYGMHDVSYVEA